MKALSLDRPAPVQSAPLRSISIPDPEPRADEVLVEVSACGVCRTDLHLVEGELRAPAYPLIPGHQAVGRVIARGAEVDTLALGDRVGVAWVGGFCRRCAFCLRGDENLCDAPTFTGMHRPGGFAERMTARAAYVHRLPDAFGDDTSAAPLLCAGIIGYRALKQSRIRPGDRVALYGFGAAAHIALQAARAWQCEVYVISRDEASLGRARELGAVWTGLTGTRLPRPVARAILFAPVGSLIPDALRDLEKGGVLSIAGIYVDRIPELDYQAHVFGEKSLVSTTANTLADARELLELAALHRFTTQVEVFPFADGNEALLRLKEGRLTAQSAVLRM
jgi:alcohol dehydrogenase, propanol-preferring